MLRYGEKVGLLLPALVSTGLRYLRKLLEAYEKTQAG